MSICGDCQDKITILQREIEDQKERQSQLLKLNSTLKEVLNLGYQGQQKPQENIPMPKRVLSESKLPNKPSLTHYSSRQMIDVPKISKGFTSSVKENSVEQMDALMRNIIKKKIPQQEPNYEYRKSNRKGISRKSVNKNEVVIRLIDQRGSRY